jgi:hypothetical protein
MTMFSFPRLFCGTLVLLPGRVALPGCCGVVLPTWLPPLRLRPSAFIAPSRRRCGVFRAGLTSSPGAIARVTP